MREAGLMDSFGAYGSQQLHFVALCMLVISITIIDFIDYATCMAGMQGISVVY